VLGPRRRNQVTVRAVLLALTLGVAVIEEPRWRAQIAAVVHVCTQRTVMDAVHHLGIPFILTLIVVG